MTKTDKQTLAGRLDRIGMVTPTLAGGQPAQPETVRDIETITGEILEAKRVGGEAIITIGQRLTEAKGLLPYGEWLSWLAEKVEFTDRTARRFMKLAKEWTDRTALSDLGATKALQLLALPEAEREEFLAGTHQVNGEEKTVIDMTSRELERAIRERDEARKAAEQAQADSRAAQEARASMEESLKTANDLLERAKAEGQAAEERAVELAQELEKLQNAPVEVAVMQVDQEALDKARAEAAAELQAQLDKAKAAKQKADEKRKAAESALADANARLEAMSQARQKADAMSDPDVAKFEVYFNEAQEVTNKMRGVLLKVRGREDQTTAEKLTRAILALGDTIRRAAE